MNKWFYLLSILLFLVVAVLCYLSLATRRDARALRKNELVLLAMVVFGIFFALTEFFALRWEAWFYYPRQTLDIVIGTQIETYLFCAVMAGLLAVATLVGAARLDRLRDGRSKRQKRPSKR